MTRSRWPIPEATREQAVPLTEAGKHLRSELGRWGLSMGTMQAAAETVLAIEAEASAHGDAQASLARLDLATHSAALRAAVEGLKFKDPEDAGYHRAYAYGHNEALDKVLELALLSETAVPRSET